jgi:transposase
MEPQPQTRKPCSTDVSDDEWAFAVPYLTLMAEDSPQRRHELREVFNGLRLIVRGGLQWRLMPHDLLPWWVVYQQTRCWMAAGVFAAIIHDLRALLRLDAGRAPQPTPRTGSRWRGWRRPSTRPPATRWRWASSTRATPAQPVADAAAQGIRLEVVKLLEAKRGFVLLPRRWVVELSFAWTGRFRRLARDYERLHTALEGFRYVALFAIQQALSTLALL